MATASQEENAKDPVVGSGSPTDTPILSWYRSDFEQRLGFRGAKHTRTNNIFTFLVALVLTVLFYTLLTQFQDSQFSSMFKDRGITPYFIVFFSLWSVSILFTKWRKLVLQRKALELTILSTESGFVLSPSTVDEVLSNLYSAVGDPKQFVLFNRVLVALSNLKNLGRVTDVDEILRSQAERDESAMDTSYSLLRGFIWAIPVFGFIGTVLGLSDAIGAFGGVLGTSSEMSEITSSLTQVTAGLSTAFETTLEALVAAVAIQLLLTFLRKSEEEFLDNCNEYCHRNVVNRLRMTPYEQLKE